MDHTPESTIQRTGEAPTRRRSWRLWIAVISLVGVITIFTVGVVSWFRPPKLVVSRATTHIIEPVDAEGYVDYVEAANRRMNVGVTPENNAAIPFVQAVGTSKMPSEIREEFFQRLGVPESHVQRTAFIAFDDFLKSIGQTPSEATRNEWDEAWERPWSASEFPQITAWLRQNEPSLALTVKASKRPRCYVPLVAAQMPRRWNAEYNVHCWLDVRSLLRALRLRAMRSVAAGDVQSAADDLLAIHRLARLCGWVLIETFGRNLEIIACRGDAHLAKSPAFTAELGRRYLDKLDELPPPRPIWDQFDFEMRHELLDTAIGFSRHGMRGIGFIGADLETRTVHSEFPRTIVNWNAALEAVNIWFDRAVAAGTKPTASERLAVLNHLEGELQDIRFSRDLDLDLPTNVNVRDYISKRVGNRMMAVRRPSFEFRADYAERNAMAFDLARLEIALHIWKSEQGRFPDALEDLAPGTLKRVPADRYTEAPLQYRLNGDGFELYSVGPNGIDDQGRSVISGADDISLR